MHRLCRRLLIRRGLQRQCQAEGLRRAARWCSTQPSLPGREEGAVASPNISICPEMFDYRQLEKFAAASTSRVHALRESLQERVEQGVEHDELRQLASRVDAVSDTLCQVSDLCGVMSSLHADPKYRRSAAAIFKSMGELMNELNGDLELYRTIACALERSEQASPAVRAMLSGLRDHMRDVGGLSLTEKQRAVLQALQAQLASLEQTIQTNAFAPTSDGDRVEQNGMVSMRMSTCQELNLENLAKLERFHATGRTKSHVELAREKMVEDARRSAILSGQSAEAAASTASGAGRTSDGPAENRYQFWELAQLDQKEEKDLMYAIPTLADDHKPLPAVTMPRLSFPAEGDQPHQVSTVTVDSAFEQQRSAEEGGEEDSKQPSDPLAAAWKAFQRFNSDDNQVVKMRCTSGVQDAVMQLSKDPDARESVFRAMAGVQESPVVQRNHALLNQLVRVRARVSHVLGYKSFADLKQNSEGPSVLESPEAAHDFITSFLQSSRTHAMREAVLLHKLKSDEIHGRFRDHAARARRQFEEGRSAMRQLKGADSEGSQEFHMPNPPPTVAMLCGAGLPTNRYFYPSDSGFLGWYPMSVGEARVYAQKLLDARADVISELYGGTRLTGDDRSIGQFFLKHIRARAEHIPEEFESDDEDDPGFSFAAGSDSDSGDESDVDMLFAEDARRYGAQTGGVAEALTADGHVLGMEGADQEVERRARAASHRQGGEAALQGLPQAGEQRTLCTGVDLVCYGADAQGAMGGLQVDFSQVYQDAGALKECLGQMQQAGVTVQSWDWERMMTEARSYVYPGQLHQHLQQSVTMPNVLKGIGLLCRDCFGVSVAQVGLDLERDNYLRVLHEASNTSSGADLVADPWHLQRLELRDLNDQTGGEGRLCGRIVLDLFDRPGKPRAAFCATLRGSRTLDSEDAGFLNERWHRDGSGEGDGKETAGADGMPSCMDGDRQVPEVILSLNLPPPLSPDAPSGQKAVPHDRAAFLSVEDAETIFHEFGHALHACLSRTEFQWHSGTRVARDFVEFPSTLLPYWLWSGPVAEQVFQDSVTSNKIKGGMLRAMRASYCMFTAHALRKSAVHALTDLEMSRLRWQDLENGAVPQQTAEDAPYHRRYHDHQSLFQAVHRDHVESVGWGAFPEGCAPHVRKSMHFVHYGGNYYTYLLSRGLASLVWQSLFEQQPLSLEHGMNLRREVLEVGGSRPAIDSVAALLGTRVDAQDCVQALVAELDQNSQMWGQDGVLRSVVL